MEGFPDECMFRIRDEAGSPGRMRDDACFKGKGISMTNPIAAGEKKYTDLSKAHRWLLLILVSMGSSVLYGPIYLKMVFYDPLMQALGCTNEQLGTLVTVYGIAALVFYLPSGIIADKVRVRTLSWIGYAGVAALTLVYALMPSYTVLMGVFVGYAVFSILIWWGTRYKLVRLICSEEEYPQKIGMSYGIYGAVGLVLSLIQTAIVSSIIDATQAVQVVLIVSAVVIAACGVASFIFIPKFEGEIKRDSKSAFSLHEAAEALKNPGVWCAALTMFFIYFVYIGTTFTTPFMTACLAAPVAVVSLIGTIRSFGVSIISAPVFGWFSKIAKSPSKVILVGTLGAIACLVALIVMPRTPSMIIVVAVLVCLMAFVTNGLYGISSGQLAETHIPPHLFGAGVGLVSVIGLLPDAFIHTWFGSMIDAQGADAFNTIFMIMIACCVLIMVLAFLTIRVSRRNERKNAGSEENR